MEGLTVAVGVLVTHSGFGSNFDQFSYKLKCNFFFIKIVSYGQIRTSR